MSNSLKVFEGAKSAVFTDGSYCVEVGMFASREAVDELAKEIARLKIFEEAMESMAAQYICPKTTALEMAQQILKKPKAGEL